MNSIYLCCTKTSFNNDYAFFYSKCSLKLCVDVNMHIIKTIVDLKKILFHRDQPKMLFFEWNIMTKKHSLIGNH